MHVYNVWSLAYYTILTSENSFDWLKRTNTARCSCQLIKTHLADRDVKYSKKLQQIEAKQLVIWEKISLMTFKLKIKFYLDVIELSLTASVQKNNLAGCWVQRTGTAELFCLAPSQRSQESMLAPVTRLDWQLLSSPAWLHSWSLPGCWLAYVESGLEPPQKPKRRLKRSLRVVGLQENGKRVKSKFTQ